MILTLFTVIVFIAELIIAFALISKLIQLDKFLIDTNDSIDQAKPKIKSIVELFKGISEQILELAPIWVQKLKWLRNKIILSKFKGVMISILLLSINVKVVQKIRKSKLCKLAFQGLSLIQDMV